MSASYLRTIHPDYVKRQIIRYGYYQIEADVYIYSGEKLQIDNNDYRYWEKLFWVVKKRWFPEGFDSIKECLDRSDKIARCKEEK